MKILTVLSFLSITACQSYVVLPISYDVSNKFDNETQEAIIEATDIWLDATAGVAKINLQFSDSPVGYTITPRKSNVQETGDIDVDNHIFLDIDKINWVYPILNRSRHEIILTTILHEFGHAMTDHDHYQSSLMTRYIDFNRPCIDKIVLKKFCEQYSCNGKEHSTCNE